MKIGFFDSGHGGLDILHEALRRYKADYFFMADRANHPYGALPLDVLHKRCVELSDVLINDMGCKLIVVACNTATAYAIDHLRQHYGQKHGVTFVGVEPYVNYINHAEAEKVKDGQVGALVTPNTLKSERFLELKKAKDPQGLVSALALAELAPAIESFVFHRDPERFQKELISIFKGHDLSGWREVILGCTHYPLVAKHISELLKVHCVSPTKAIIDQMVRVIEHSSQELMVEPTPEDMSFMYCDTMQGGWRKALIGEFLPLP